MKQDQFHAAMNARIRTHYGKGVTFGERIRCAETGEVFTAARDGMTTNYARDSHGRLLSDRGVDIRERRALVERAGPVLAYISGDGRHVTGWKGNVLGDVVHSHRIGCGRRSYIHGGTLRAIRVRDVHGGHWYGCGSPGIAVTLRPCKGG